MNIIKKAFINLIKNLGVSGIFLIALLIALGVFNANTSLNPKIKQLQREREIQTSFNEWWETEGAEKFKSVGLEPTQKLKDEEFEQYRERFLATYHTFVIEDRIEEMKVEFRDWWENKGGKEEYADEHGFFPNETHYQAELKKWITKYTDKFIRYSWAYVPERAKSDTLFTCWLLTPSVWSYLVFAIFFSFAFFQLRNRWNIFIIFGLFLFFAVTGGFFASILVDTGFFNQHMTSRYMGTSIPLVFLLGATAFGYNKEPVPAKITHFAFFGLVASMAVDWLLNPGIFKAVVMESPVFFTLGAIVGTKIPTQEKKVAKAKVSQGAVKSQNRNTVFDRKENTRRLISEGFSAAQNGQNEEAKRMLTQAMSNLLQEHPIDPQDVIVLSERLTNPSFFIDIPSVQWLEWGQTAKNKNAPEAAIKLLKKGVSSEKDKVIVRRATYTIGETQVMNKIDIEEGLVILDNLIKENGKDVIAAQARKIIQQVEERNKAEFIQATNKIMSGK